MFVQGCFSKTLCPPLPGSIFPAAADWPFTLPVPWGTWRWPRREGRRQSSLYVCGALNILHYTERWQFEFQADRMKWSCVWKLSVQDHISDIHSPSNLIPTYHYQISLAVLTQNTFPLVFASQALLACSQIIIYLLQCIWGAAKCRGDDNLSNTYPHLSAATQPTWAQPQLWWCHMCVKGSVLIQTIIFSVSKFFKQVKN